MFGNSSPLCCGAYLHNTGSAIPYLCASWHPNKQDYSPARFQHPELQGIIRIWFIHHTTAALEASGHWQARGKHPMISAQAQFKIFILLIFDVLFSFILAGGIRGVKGSKTVLSPHFRVLEDCEPHLSPLTCHVAVGSSQGGCCAVKLQAVHLMPMF